MSGLCHFEKKILHVDAVARLWRLTTYCFLKMNKLKNTLPGNDLFWTVWYCRSITCETLTSPPTMSRKKSAGL